MKMEKHWKRFFTLDRHHAEGFTLVELIVVIAILAILGGVAVPAYSGYVKKAELAGDQQLLAAINKAFAAACVDNGVDVHNVDSATLTLTAEKAVQEVNPYNDAFVKYYVGNENAKFTSGNAIAFDSLKHAFVLLVEGETVALSYGGGYVYINADDAKNLSGSTFITADGLGAAALLNKVNDVSVFAAALDGSSTYNQILSSLDYQKTIVESLGYDLNELEDGDVQAIFNMKLGELRQQKYAELTTGMTDLTADEQASYMEYADDLVKANMAVLHAAQNTPNDDQINTLLNSSTPTDDILATMKTDSGAGLSQAALFYGMYTSFAYSEEYGSTARQEATDNPVDLLSDLDADEIAEFQKYINSDQGKADLEAYKSSMNMINSSTGDSNAVTDVLVSGFANQDLIDLVEQATGTN